MIDVTGANRARVHDAAARDRDVDRQLVESFRRKRQRIVAQHDDVGQLAHLDAAERPLLEARVRGVDGLAAERVAQRQSLLFGDALAAQRLTRHGRSEIA